MDRQFRFAEERLREDFTPETPRKMKVVNPRSMPQPRGYNNGVLAEGRMLFVAGQVGWDKDGNIANGFVAQFDQALANILEVVHEAGGTAQDIGRFTIFVKDKSVYLAQRKPIGEVYRKHMGKHFPAMTLVEVKDLLEEGALVEIEATAVLA